MENEKNLNKYGQSFQLTALSLFFKDKAFCSKIKGILLPDYFDNKYTQAICQMGVEYLEKYFKFPEEDKIFEIIKSTIERTKSATSKIYLGYLDNIKNADLSSSVYVKEEIEKFCFTKFALQKLEEQKNNIELGQFEEAKNIAMTTYVPVNSNYTELKLTEAAQVIAEQATIHRPVPSIFPTFNFKSKGGPGAGDLAVVVAQSSFGKCFAKGTKIRMFDNSIKNVEDICVGDKIMGWDGKSRNVSSLANGIEQMYEIQQQYGDNYIVNESHILCLKPTNNYLKNYPTLTNEKVNITVKEYLKQSNTWKKNHKGYSSEIKYASQVITIDPYFLGLWLGDGNKSMTQVCGTDEIIGKYIQQYAEKLNLKFSTREDKNKVKYWNIVETQGKINFLRKQFENYSLFYNKHIPNEYLYNSKEIRLKLLAGLIDSDGYLEKKVKQNFEISQKDYTLARQIFLLCRSLGFKTSIRKKKINFHEKEFIIYTVRISYNTHIIPTLLERKKALPSIKGATTNLSSVKVIKKEIGEYFGFTLSDKDPDRMFLLEDYTVVHNTAYLTALARYLATIGKKVLYFSLETDRYQLISRCTAGLVNIEQENLSQHPKLVKTKIKEITDKNGEVLFVELKAISARIGSLKLILEEKKAQGFFPDVIIVDGLNQLKLPKGIRNNDNNDKFEYLAEELRDWGKEEQFPIWCSFQTNRCLSLDTLVDLKDKGKVRIANLKEGEEILTHQGYKKITKIFPIETQPVYKIKLKSGKEIICSGEHEFPLKNGNLLNINNGLREGFKLLVKKD